MGKYLYMARKIEILLVFLKRDAQEDMAEEEGDAIPC